jgi:uncharacterized membrane protein YebE (DUF533 family)
MFDPQRLLGQLLGDALGGSLGGGRRQRRRRDGNLLGGLSAGCKVSLGLGALGLALAAYEHYRGGQGPAPAASASTPPPPPNATAAAVPPPPPGAAMPPPPPASAEASLDALHLLRAMITAAQADGLIDDAERGAILQRARDSGLGAEDLAALEAEIAAPFTLEQLVARTPAAQREAVYAAALIAITADTEAERAFLDRLGNALQLEPARRERLAAELG